MNPVPTEYDTQGLIDARQFEIDTLNTWVREFHEERKTIKSRIGQK